ncbi:MAG: 50S ribosomal protein L22 [Candidatus Thermoplasmatota archaeon]|jgi:large subunit ribosomal protein L22|nr:50S ribosomal protein L22 [Candidatus Thermoplasmatota archaeon]
MKGYSIEEIPEKTAIALKKNCNISVKDSVNVAHNIRGMMLSDAVDFLNLVLKKEKPVKYFRYLDSVSHRKGAGPGRYPVKACKSFLQLLENVESNAEFKGLNTDSLRILHITADKGTMLKRYTPKAYGRAGANNRDMVNLAVVVKEVEEE